MVFGLAAFLLWYFLPQCFVLNTLLSAFFLVTYLLMVILNLLRIKVPGPVVECASIIGGANSFMAMFMIGVGFKLTLSDRSQMAKILRILSVRYGVAALLAVIFYFVLPFDIQVCQALVILAFSPIGTAVPPFTGELGGDVGLSSAINSMAIVISISIYVVLLSVML